MPIFWYVLIAVFAAAAAFFIAVGWKISSMLLHPKVVLYDTAVDKEVERGNFTREWFDQTVRLEEFTLCSPFGYDLHCAIWPHKNGAAFSDGKARVAVLVHGFTYCLLGGIKYASILHDFGFDCVFYDHRNHGLSGRAPTTMGAYESRDLAFVCAWARERFGEDAVLGTHGESMGAATVMLHAAIDPRLAFAIEDCGYSDLKRELRFVMRNRYHMPAFLTLQLASLFCRLRGGVFFGSVVPRRALKSSTHVPMLFVHGDADDLVPYGMLTENYNAKTGAKTMRTFPGAAHASCYTKDPSAYRVYIEEFLRENGII